MSFILNLTLIRCILLRIIFYVVCVCFIEADRFCLRGRYLNADLGYEEQKKRPRMRP